MAGLLYREDMDEVRERSRAWWDGDGIGRPIMHVFAPREEPIEEVEVMPTPEGWLTDYSVTHFEYRVNLAKRACVNTHYLAEAVPVVSPDLGPNCLALYLGCEGVDEPGTVWFKPCIDGPETARFEYDQDNFYWEYTLRLAREMLRIGHGKFMLQFPDLIEGLDTLAAMRGTEKTLADLMERPEWVQACMRTITDLYFHYYDILYDMTRDEAGGSFFWLWAPGRMTKLQCDFSAMISPDMFEEFMGPVLQEMGERTSYTLYHWDGPGALPHLDALLSIPTIDCIQWVPGAPLATPDDKEWWPLYHRMLEAGKLVFIHHVRSIDDLKAMKREFGDKFNRFFLIHGARSLTDAEEFIRAAEI
jgi:5-methyltetrahydrofolate--homocysteine methyltransferase